MTNVEDVAYWLLELTDEVERQGSKMPPMSHRSDDVEAADFLMEWTHRERHVAVSITYPLGDRTVSLIWSWNGRPVRTLDDDVECIWEVVALALGWMTNNG